MHPSGFFTFILVFLITLVGILFPAPLNLLPLLFVFVFVPLVDMFLGTVKTNPTPDQENRWKKASVWGPALYLYSLSHIIILILGSLKAMVTFSAQELVILGVNVGLYTGGLGITVAHELCHKKEKVPRFVADLLLASVWYQHFAVEHVKGHHLNVSTPEDPASARKNENIYKFLVRTLTGSFLHALKIDSRVVMRGILMAVLFTVFFAFIGNKALVFFIIQAVVAVILLELVNYVEHYGLHRKQLPNGRYEKVLPIHSWNSSHRFSNAILFNLQRHSDHHALAHLPYTVLKHHEEAPQLPSGYPAMILLALIPSAWFTFMNPKVERWEEAVSGK